MLSDYIVPILISVVLILLVGVVASFIIRSRLSKDKAPVGEYPPQDQVSTPGRESSPDQESQQAKVEAEPDKLQVAPPNYGLQLVLDDDRTFHLELPSTIGRSDENTIVISDDSVSAQHARIYLDERVGAVCIEDLHSLNGVFVDGRPTSKNILDDSARITLGSVSLTFRDTGFLPPSK
jgi:pSer/pThr/pTyr-binding forkhead associated (FHA) protein